MGAITSTILGAGALATGVYGAVQARRSAKQQQRAWEEMAEPQKEFMRQMYPLQLRQMEAYTPYYETAAKQAQELLPYQKQAIETYMPAYTRLYEDIEEYAAREIQPWEREAVSVPFMRARELLGERAAGTRTLGAGPTQKLATLYDIAEAEALTQLPYARRERALEYQLRSMGLQPSAAAISAPGQIGVSIPAQPAAYQAPGIDWASIGKIMGLGRGIGTPSPVIQGGVGGTSTGYQTLPSVGGGMPFPTWSPN